jgi:hypothetical protein
LQDPGAKYELRQQIGRGSFGSAFLVTNKQDNAEFVLKRVRLAKQTKWQRNSTLQERQLVSRSWQEHGVAWQMFAPEPDAVLDTPDPYRTVFTALVISQG